MEKWKEIIGFEGYFVSDDGRVKTEDYNHTGRVREIKIFENEGGYMACNLMRRGSRKRKTVHQLVAIAFIDNPNSYQQVNHKNGDKTDNRVENLEWCNGSQNVQHAFDTGLVVAHKGDTHYRVKVSEEQVREIRKLREFGMRLHKIAALYGICFQHVSGIFHKRYRV